MAVTLLVACIGITSAIFGGCAASQRRDNLHAQLVSVNVARDGFVEWDALHQLEIVSGATTLADGQARLVTYRGARVQITNAFELAYRALAVAALNSDDLSYRSAMKDVENLLVTLRKLDLTRLRAVSPPAL